MTRSALLCMFTLGAAGCGAIVDFPDSPQLEQGPWQCLSAAQDAVAPKVTQAKVTVHACDFVTNCTAPVTGLSARLCSKRDVGCTNPIKTGIMDKDGDLSFEVATSGGGFDGYLEVTAPSERCNAQVFGELGPMLCQLLPECDLSNPDDQCQFATYVRSLLFFNPPITADVPEPIALPMLSATSLPSVVQAAGANLDPTTGNLFITALDCTGTPAAGVTYSISQNQDKVTQLYMDNGVVSDTKLETDSSGIGGFVGVPAGFAEVTGYNADNKRVGSIGVQAAPFTMTYSALVPSDQN